MPINNTTASTLLFSINFVFENAAFSATLIISSEFDISLGKRKFLGTPLNRYKTNILFSSFGHEPF